MLLLMPPSGVWQSLTAAAGLRNKAGSVQIQFADAPVSKKTRKISFNFPVYLQFCNISFCSYFALGIVGYLWYNKAILTERVFFMPRIIPIKDLKDTSGVSELCHSMKEPIFITKNGYGDMVLMSMELFEEQRKKWEIYSEIELSEEQIAQGKTKNAKDALASVRKKYGL
jgi:PHD/YefM family antitoxin component YafN of YafNO toxin-antitoxin module